MGDLWRDPRPNMRRSIITEAADHAEKRRHRRTRCSRRWSGRLLLVFGALPAALGIVAAQRGIASSPTASIQLLAFNDFHGALEPPAGENGLVHTTLAGGAAYLATHLKRAAARNPNTLIVAAGDLVGGSPLISAAFHDEPTVASLNAMNLTISSVGNHEFDHGPAELLRLQKGGCHPRDGCRDGGRFDGAGFQYLAANVIDTATGTPLLPPTAVRTLDGVKVGFIGETLKGADRLVVPSAVGGLAFLDEASTANTHAAELKRQGVNAIVLLIHEGGRQRPDDSTADPNRCDDFSGNIAGDIKVVVSAHTHRFYNCVIAGHTVTSAGSFGRMFTRIDLRIDRSSGRISRVRAMNQIVTRDVDRDATQTKIVAQYRALSSPIAERVVGSIAGSITRASNSAGESALGDVIADAQLAAARSMFLGGAAVAFMNPGGIRADLVSRAPAGSVRFGDLFIVMPFNNVITTVTLTGDQIARLLEQQFDNPRQGQNTFLQVSEGFTYRYAAKAKPGHHVAAGSVTVDGRRLAPGDRVRVAANNFLIDGGDGFTAFQDGISRLNGDLDLDALVAYFATHSPVRPGSQNRIVRID
jgi:5'-nucleotidase